MITSTSNQQMKNLSALMKKSKERKRQGVFVVEGTKMVAEAPAEWIKNVYMSEAYEKALEHQELIRDFRKKGIAFEIVADNVFKSVSDTQTPQGILAIVKMPSYSLEQMLQGDKTHLLILESIQDPGNLGTMVRTGEGAGITGIIMNQTTVDLFNPKTIRSTMGSIYRVPFYIAENLEKTLEVLKEQGVQLFAAHLKGTGSYDEANYTTSTGFLIGNEGNGLSDAIANIASCYIKIPMEGQVESLNAAISATLLMYEANRQRRRNSENLV